jgi:hypothetical protein
VNKEKLENLSLEPFKLGKRSVTLNKLLGAQAITRTGAKFSDYSEHEVYIALREFIRYLFLTANSDTSVFFPGTKLMDDVWHSFIVETAEYKVLCSKLRPGHFLEHSGMKFEEYSSLRSPENLNEEQLSWLVSYVDNFGPIDEAAYAQLVLAQNLASRLNFEREKLNQFAERLLIEAKKQKTQTPFSLKIFLENDIAPLLSSIADNSTTLETVLRHLLEGMMSSRSGSETLLLTNEELEAVYVASTTLGFTLWQHLAAVERLVGYEEWQQQNAVLWSEISSAQKLVGLGTTHLAHSGPPPLTGKLTKEGYVLSGTLPWVTGTGIFDFLLLAFETEEERIFSLIPFPNLIDADEKIKIHPLRLACINGSSTSRISFSNFLVKNDQLIFKLDKKTPRPNRKSQYVFPDLGMAIAAQNTAAAILAESQNPRHLKAKEEIKNLSTRLEELKAKREKLSELNPVEVTYEKDDLIRDSVRFLVLVTGGSAISHSSFASRLLLETMLLDVLIQDPRLIEKKLTETAHE